MSSRADNQLAERTANEAMIDLAVLVARLEKGMSSWTAQLRGMAVNDVLDCELATLNANGLWSRDWAVPFAAIAVSNHGPALVVASDPPQATAPSGPGAHPIGAGAGEVVNLTGRALTLYGAPGAVVGLQVFARPQPPGFGRVVTNLTTRRAESAAPVLAAVTVNGASLATTGYTKLRAFASSDVAGNLSVQQSRDGATWYTTVTQAVAASSAIGTIVESILTLPFARAQYVNGAANQGAFEFDTELVA